MRTRASGAVTAAVIENNGSSERLSGEQLILHKIHASQCDTRPAGVFRLVPAKPALTYSLAAILADPYLSTFPDCSVRSCLYMVDLIMITAPQDQTQSTPTTPPTLLTWLRPLGAAARVPSECALRLVRSCRLG